MKRFLALAFAAFFALVSVPAMAAPLAYANTIYDTPNSAVIALTTTLNSTMPSLQYTTSCTGTTTSTCQGLKIAVSTTGLTTAAGVTATAMTVTDASVTAASIIMCQANGYAGTGNPVALNVVPGAGSFTFQIENTHASAALNATVVTACMIYN